MPTLGLMALAFLLGSIPFGLLIGRVRGIDIRQHGSKNIGATNVGRVLGKPMGFLCFFLDFAKGFAPTLLAGWQLGGLGRLDAPAEVAWSWLSVMTASVLGHMFSPWIGFKGGKGVATGFGALVAVWPALGLPALLAFVVWLVVVLSTRYMGLSSCLAALSLPAGVWLCPTLARALNLAPQDHGNLQALAPHLVVATALGLFVVWKHRANIQRMMRGTELRLGGRPTAPNAANKP